MSSSGIDLSSILQALGSSSSGIDVSSAVSQVLATESAPQQEWQQEQVTLQGQTTALNTLEGEVSSLQTSLNALGDPAGAITSMAANSSNSAVVAATASAGTPAGNHVVVVNNMATAASWYSSPVATSSTQLSPGSFQLQVGSAAPVSITIGNGVNTLDQLVNYINGLGLGVTASVVNDARGARLAMVSNNTGLANGFTVSNASGLTFTQAGVAQDAALTIDGIPIDSASNTVTGALSGVTLNLLGAAPNSPVNVSVTPDTSSIISAVQGFVSSYNALINDVNSQFSVNGNNQEGVLAGDSTVRMLQSTLLSAINYSGGNGPVTQLTSLGISMNNDGTLNLDTSALTGSVTTNPSAVEAFFQGTASNGFAASVNAQLDSFTDATSGAFTVDLESISNENTDLQNQIDDFQTYLDSEKTRLTQEYSTADSLLQQLPIEEQQIDAELGLNNSKGTSNG